MSEVRKRRRFATREEAHEARKERMRKWNRENPGYHNDYIKTRYKIDDEFREETKARAREYYHRVVKPAREARKKEMEYGDNR